jgi:hypothetical protein
VTDVRWRQWLGQHPILGPALVGFMATQMATIIGYYLKGVGLPPVPWPLYNGALFAPTAEFGSAGSFFAGQSIHMVDGIVLTMLFVLLLRSRIPLPNTTQGSIGKGLVFGTSLAIMSAGFLVPYVYVPKSGFGFFSFGTPDGWKLPASILLFHWAYGFFVGVLYNPATND